MAVRFFYVQHGQRPSFDKFGSLYCDSREFKVRLGENMLGTGAPRSMQFHSTGISLDAAL